MSDGVDAHVEKVAAHRPYGLDCKCGHPINSDADWARHLIDALQLTEEWGVTGHSRQICFANWLDPTAPNSTSTWA